MSLAAHEALDRLKQGNERFCTGRSTGPGRVGDRHAELLKGQEPFAIVLGCADSRVALEILFDTGLGELFVVRVAGNVANTSSIASIEYAVANLGSKLILVLAHQSCGAVAATIAGGDAGKNLNHLLGHIRPSIGESSSDVDTVARRNARGSAERLMSESDIVRSAVDRGEVEIVTGFFHFVDGRVEFGP